MKLYKIIIINITQVQNIVAAKFNTDVLGCVKQFCISWKIQTQNVKLNYNNDTTQCFFVVFKLNISKLALHAQLSECF